MKLLQHLFYYRGMTALQLTQMYYELEMPLSSQKSNIHNYLAKLKKQSLVVSKKLDNTIQSGSIYYLTHKGFEAVKEMLDIEVGAKENGFILLNERNGISTQSDLPYSLYQPPKQQLNHHLLLIDLFIRLRVHFEETEPVDHRLSMYCSTPYTLDGMDGKIRPDAEIILPDKQSFWIEVDCATESHSQLLAKFENYKNYLSHLKRNNLPIPFKGIIFLTEAKQQTYGLKRRWSNILSAFLKAMYPYQTDIRLILTPLNRVEETLLFEMQRFTLNEWAKRHVHDKLHQSGYEMVLPYIKSSDHSLSYAIAINKKSYKIFFLHVGNVFDSTLYTSFHQFIQKISKIHQKDEVKHLQQQGFEQIIYHPSKDPYIIQTLQGDHMFGDLGEELKLLSQNVEFIEMGAIDV